ncbi:MAG: MgtC/SapB family protein [Candidatus Woesearchaeota archaeon]|nr:MgtC/SapB family protein [Candidatus Woesearchaeota archaeon]
MVFAENPLLLDFYRFMLSICLGALIGLEREKSHSKHKGADFAGVRTFIFYSLFGSLAAYLSSIYYSWIIAVALVCFILLIIAAYILSTIISKHAGMTTELSGVIAFIIGALVFTTQPEIPIALAILVTVVLSLKKPLHHFAHHIKQMEFYDTIKFILIAFVILPLLKPIKPFGPYESIYLYEIWLMVVFVSSLSYVAYILMNLYGSSKGIFITGLLGGALSSTATVTSLANKSKESNDNSTLVAAAGIACATMFLRVLIVTSILRFNLIEMLAFPLLLLTLVGFITVSIIWKKHSHTEAKVDFKSPLMLGPALKFGIFYAFILFLSSFMNAHYGSKGIFLAALISGFADVDAMTLFIVRNPIAIDVSVTAIIIAAITNTFIKIVIAKSFGAKDFANGMLKILVPIIGVGLIFIFIG